MSRRASYLAVIAMASALVTLAVVGRMEGSKLRAAHAAELEQLRAENLRLHEKYVLLEEGCRLNSRFESDAFQDLLGAHEQLQNLHRASLVWGPMRSPRDCVLETILMDDDKVWPVRNPEAQLAESMAAHDWCEEQRHQLLTELDDLSYCWSRWPDKGGDVGAEVHAHLKHFRWNNCDHDPHLGSAWIYPEAQP